MSGRGLGHTGGTLDKLESIRGFRVELSTEEFIEQVRSVDLAIVGATADLVPADKKLYALRDVTATVDNYSLIAASIMSKKIAGGADAVVLDVKVGDGAFMKARADAERLAEVMIDLGRRAGREVVAVISDMDEPLGHAVGNALEIREAIATLRGEGPPDFVELVTEASARLLALSDLGVTYDEARRRVEQAIADGSAVKAYERWIAAQGGDPDEGALPTAPVLREAKAAHAGAVISLGAVQIGTAALRLGAGPRPDRDARPARVPWLGHARVARGRDRTCGPEPEARRPSLRGRSNPRLAADASGRSRRGGCGAHGRAGPGSRSSRQVSDFSVRKWSCSPDSPPDDGDPPALAKRSPGRGPRASCCQARRHVGHRLSRHQALRNLARAPRRRA